MATRKNQLKTLPIGPCCPGAINSASFNPGENNISTGAGIAGSFSAASARHTNPSGSATTAGSTNRNIVRELTVKILAASPHAHPESAMSCASTASIGPLCPVAQACLSGLRLFVSKL